MAAYVSSKGAHTYVDLGDKMMKESDTSPKHGKKTVIWGSICQL